MKKFVLDHLQSVYCDSMVCRLDTEEGDLVVEYKTGQKIAITIINRAARFDKVKDRYEHNTAKNIHTLFLVDGRMMPPDRSEIEPPVWMLAIHNLTNGRIYSYWCEGRAVTIRPLHLGWKWGSKLRPVQYGNEVDTAKLNPHRIETTVGTLTGVYATANFGEGTFWKKQDPRGTDYNYYSWRNWRYSERPNQNQQRDQDENPEWEPWEEFNRRFEEAYEEPRRQQRQAPPQRRAVSDQALYALLGVQMGASLDEVKQAYRRKAREYHPDLHPEHREKYTAKMADINAAYEAISKKLSR